VIAARSISLAGTPARGRKRPGRIEKALLSLAALCLAQGGGPLDELPYPPAPPDPLSLLTALHKNLPANWRMGQPSVYLNIAQVKINIPDQWRGNPVAAAVSLCPWPEDDIWRQVRVFRLIMRYRQQDWPPYECRP